MHFLRSQADPLFALLDAARDPKVLGLLMQHNEECQSLYAGVKGITLAAYAPYLVQFSLTTELLEDLVGEGWGKSWGIYLTSNKSFDEVRKHFRHFLMVKLEDDQEAYFRFYDPRVLRVFLPTCTAEELKEFFGPVGCYLVEGGQSERLLKFSPGEKGRLCEEIQISPVELLTVA